MRGVLHARKSVLLVLIMVSMLLISACDSDNTPTVPVPTATTAQSVPATATTVQSVAPTATTPTQANTNPTATTAANNQPTPAPKGSLGGAKAGTISQITRPAPKGDLAKHDLSVAKHDTPLEELEARKTPTTTPEPTPTEEVSTQNGNVPDGWTVVLDDDFSQGDSGTWIVGDAGNFSTDLEDGKLVMTAQGGYGFFNWADETDNWDNGYISATVEIDGSGVVGLAARASKIDGNWNDVLCLISASGNYSIYVELDGGSQRVASGRNTAIKKNDVNELAVLGDGQDFTFFVNGKAIKTFSGGDVEEGAWGTYVESPTGDTTTGAFSRILFMAPGEEPSEPTATATTEEGEATATATVEEEEATATPTAGTSENAIVSTDFSQDEGTWYTGSGIGYSVSVEDGELAVESDSPNGVVATSADEALDITDGRIEATLRIEDGSEDNPGFVGVSARSQEFASDFEDWSQIFCGISVAGVYSCDRLSMAASGIINFKELLHGETDSIDPSGQNTITLTGKGSRWTFEINGVKVGSFTDNSVKEGAWGVLVLSGDDITTGFFSEISIFED